LSLLNKKDYTRKNHLLLEHDPSTPGFILEDGWLVAREAPGLGSLANFG